jgi:hypothetical protein
MKSRSSYIKEAQQIIVSLGLPRGQQNERPARVLLTVIAHEPEAVSRGLAE